MLSIDNKINDVRAKINQLKNDYSCPLNNNVSMSLDNLLNTVNQIYNMSNDIIDTVCDMLNTNLCTVNAIKKMFKDDINQNEDPSKHLMQFSDKLASGGFLDQIKNKLDTIDNIAQNSIDPCDVIANQVSSFINTELNNLMNKLSDFINNTDNFKNQLNKLQQIATIAGCLASDVQTIENKVSNLAALSDRNPFAASVLDCAKQVITSNPDIKAQQFFQQVKTTAVEISNTANEFNNVVDSLKNINNTFLDDGSFSF